MTEKEVIAKLRTLYSDIQYADAEVRHVEADVFCVRENGNMTLYRLNEGILERRVDYDFHTCGWETVE